MARSLPLSARYVPALVLLAGLAMPLSPGAAMAADDGTCVGRGEYKAIKSGMTIDKLGEALHGQTPFADEEAKGKQRTRWYAACDIWQPDKDVAVRYHQPVVGRRTVTKKSLRIYVAPTP